MRRIGWLCLFLVFAAGLYGQQQENPFDLKFRSPKPVSKPSTPVQDPDTATYVAPPVQSTTTVIDSTPFKTDISRDSNPFDLNKNVESKTDKNIVNPVLEEVKKTFPLKQRSSKGLQIFFLLLSLLFLIFIVNVERSFVKDLWRVISNENYGSLHLRNQRNTMRQILLMMGYVVFIIQAGIFLYHVLVRFGYNGTFLDNIWTCMGLVAGVYVIRHSVIRYLKWLFNNDKEMTLFGFDVSIFNIMVGLVLLPINVLLNFGPESMANPLIYIGIMAAVTAYLMRQLRWMLTARQLISNSLFLFFVYLCAVEILPLWAISKFFW